MGHASHSSGHSSEVQPRDPAKIKHLLVVTAILGVLTAIEFVLAFTMERGIILTTIFVLMTLVKTFYIVGEFMHLKYEVKLLIWAISLPVIFILWLILSQLMEATYVLHALKEIFG